MVLGILIFSVLLGVPDVSLVLAPDQPVPHIYVGDPLVIELISTEDLQVDVFVEVIGEKESLEKVRLSNVVLQRRKPRWLVVPDVAQNKGRYIAHVILQKEGFSKEFSEVFCRIDRPEFLLSQARSKGILSPICVCGDEILPEEYPAIYSAGVTGVTLSFSPGMNTDRLNALWEEGFQIGMRVNTVGVTSSEEFEEFLRNFSDKIVYFEIREVPDVSQIQFLLKTVRQFAPSLRVYITINDPSQLGVIVGELVSSQISGFVIERTSSQEMPLSVYRSVTERAGIERAEMMVSYTGDAVKDPTQLLTQIWLDFACGASRVFLPTEMLYRERRFGDIYVAIGTMNRILPDSSFVGNLSSDRSVTALCFRQVDEWKVVVWSREDKREFSFDSSNITDLQFFDKYMNPIQIQERKEGDVVQLFVSKEPICITGKGGSVLIKAATATVNQDARLLLENSDIRSSLPSDFVSILSELSQSKSGRLDRNRFFVLARTFVYLEKQWHEGALSVEVAMPTIAGLARLMRSLCILEEAVGEPFVEPLQDVLMRCSQYQSSFLTKMTNNTRERGGWILEEVGRLITESKMLSEQGRGIEAAALANVAEWRARSLDFLESRGVVAAPTEQKQPTVLQTKEEEEAVAEKPKQAQPVVKTDDVSTEPERVVFQVVKGDNPSVIARKHGVSVQDVLKWNNWDPKRILRIGEEYIIYKKSGDSEEKR